MADEDQIIAFIGSTFRSVWAIEVLRYLANSPDISHSADDLNAQLRVSNSVIDQSIGQLLAVALVVVDDDGLIRFQPANADLASFATDALSLYERRPNQVRRAIVSQTSPSISAFSEAFKLRKD